MYSFTSHLAILGVVWKILVKIKAAEVLKTSYQSIIRQIFTEISQIIWVQHK